ncbi:MAG: hypothetical protein JRG83_15260 [Deltaproteobacteria bacterium]|nr:hypothetical protein [Deltaproteobacteria bacterium]
MVRSSSIGRRLGLALLWSAVTTGLVVGFAAALAGLALAGLAIAGIELGEVQRAVWLAIARSVATTALAPLGVFTLVAWWILTAVRPAFDATWRSILVGTFGLAALGFPPVGAGSFTIWKAETPFDYGATWLLVAGGVTAALVLARRVVPVLGPGAFGARLG